jgi:membrane protease subunit HflK
VVGTSEQGVLEHFGVASTGPPLEPGLHAHLPWPVDSVSVVAVREARTLKVGHGGSDEPGGPEDVLWARQHAAQEYTLVLGDGHDLVTIDAAVHFRVRDPLAWTFGCQNPTAALSAVAYRAVMDATVDRTLADVLSENVAVLTTALRADVQRDADALGLGVDVLGFTVGGMHPPVPVARDYQAVVSAQVDRQTEIIDAQAYANALIPAAEGDVVATNNTARAEGAKRLAKAAGEAWAFRTLESVYHADPAEFRFRRRLEALESALPGRALTILDDRIEKDGGQLWIPE